MQDDPSAARHAATASSTGGQLARRWLLTLRWHLLLLFLSDFGRGRYLPQVRCFYH